MIVTLKTKTPDTQGRDIGSKSQSGAVTDMGDMHNNVPRWEAYWFWT